MRAVLSNTKRPPTSKRHTTSEAINILNATRYIIPLFILGTWNNRSLVVGAFPITAAGPLTLFGPSRSSGPGAVLIAVGERL